MNKLTWVKRAYIVFLLCTISTIALNAQTVTTLQTFDYTDGGEPLAGLVQASDGNLYGTTSLGGAYLQGTIFKLTPSGALTTLYSFCSQSNCTDGKNPFAPLLQANNGKFYGTTELGGANGEGTVFEITPSGELTTLYSFCSQSECNDGQQPLAGLIQAADGNFYGITQFGGVNGEGTVFKITPAGTLTTLYSFCSESCADGSSPYAALVQATNGALYGTTFYGGANGAGTVFKITSTGALTTLYSFCSQSNCADGSYPNAGLVEAADGNFYGTTEQGGLGIGTVFRITPAGALTRLYSFCSQGNCADGEYPTAALVPASDGNLYGTTAAGGARNYGTAFQITPAGTLTTLYSFCAQSGCADGQQPYSALVQDTNGKFYGDTQLGGSSTCTLGCGTVYELNSHLRAFVETQPAFGRAGTVVRILGTELTGATSVRFNGTAAAFTVVSPSLITSVVPVGATIGKVAVVTPSATLSSNVPFRVVP